MKEFNYNTEIIHVSKLFNAFDKTYINDSESVDIYQYYEKAMNQGDRIREALNTNDALAQKAISEIARIRDEIKKKRECS